MTTTRADLAQQIGDTMDIDYAAARDAVDVYAGQLDAPDGHLSDENAEHIRQALAAEFSVASHAPLDAVIEATAAKDKANQDAEEADRVWREAIRAAVMAGERVVEIAEAARISRDRVYQIRDGRR